MSSDALNDTAERLMAALAAYYEKQATAFYASIETPESEDDDPIVRLIDVEFSGGEDYDCDDIAEFDDFEWDGTDGYDLIMDLLPFIEQSNSDELIWPPSHQEHWR